jgi:2-polyprenyl-3-methyl-5-hydroxy-6-metoxy-1,4-benzoquinol methylase
MSDFDRYSATYDDVLNAGLSVTGEDKEYFAAARVRWTARQLESLAAATYTVLDFGCGTGGTVPLLARELGARRVVGVDVSRASIDSARRAYGSDRLQFALTEELPSADRFDVIYVNGVLHHVAASNQSSMLSTIAGSLHPGGVLALWENNPYNPGTRWVMKRLPFDRDAVMLKPSRTRRLVAEAGLRVLSTQYAFFFPRMLSMLRPVESHLRSVPLGGQYLVLAERPRLKASA